MRNFKYQFEIFLYILLLLALRWCRMYLSFRQVEEKDYTTIHPLFTNHPNWVYKQYLTNIALAELRFGWKRSVNINEVQISDPQRGISLVLTDPSLPSLLELSRFAPFFRSVSNPREPSVILDTRGYLPAYSNDSQALRDFSSYDLLPTQVWIINGLKVSGAPDAGQVVHDMPAREYEYSKLIKYFNYKVLTQIP